MARKRKTLPKNFEELLVAGNIKNLIKVFDKCELDAYERFGKRTALAFDECPHKLAKWLVDKGANIEAKDRWGKTPLNNRSSSKSGNIKSLLELGANVNDKNYSIGSSLHSAASSHIVLNTKILIQYGANIFEKNREGYIPLEIALKYCYPVDIKNTVKLSKIYLGLGVEINPNMEEFVREIGREFEFFRIAIDKESVESLSKSLRKLYQFFKISPVPKRRMHDGISKITVHSKSLKEQYYELCDLLVPGIGPAQTVQGEVIRISGKVTNELKRNGGVNWDSEYNKMVNSFIKFMQIGNKLSENEIDDLRDIKHEIRNHNVETTLMRELAVKWVLKNTIPINLPIIKYKR